MKFKNFLESKILSLCAIGLIAIIIYVFAKLLQANTALIICMELCLMLFTVGWLLIAYFMQKNRIKKLQHVMDKLDEKYLLGELLPPPKNETETVYYEIMKTVSRGAIGAVEKAKREKEEYTEYIENWVHEIKTPLTACSLILQNGADASKLRRELLRADNLTETVLYYARMKSPEKDTLIRPFYVSDIIGEAVKSQMTLLIAAGVSVEVTGDFSVTSDDKALGFIISQLLVNSAKYCPSCHITITAKDGTITFEDNGIGIPAHELSRITERGFTGTNGRKLGSSTGMGLYIVQELCKHLAITLSIVSEEYKFTRFCLSYDSLTKV